MINYNEIFEKLKSNNSRLFKESVLGEYKNDETLQKIFYMGLNPHINYYIKKIPEYTKNYEGTITLEESLELLYGLSNREYTGHDGINYLKNILESLDYKDAQIIENIIQRDFKCGVSTSTVNKIFNNIIQEYPVMLATVVSEKLLNNIQFPAYAQIKYDGMRFNAIVRTVARFPYVEFRSRSGKVYDFLGYLEQDFASLGNGVYDGELWVDSDEVNQDDDHAPIPMTRAKGNGIIQKAGKGTITENDAKRIHCSIWDYIPYDDFISGYCKMTQEERYNILERMNLPKKIHLAENHIINSPEDAMELSKKYIDTGHEGIILKDMYMPWEAERVKHQLKYKDVKTADLLCTGYLEGEGKYEGLIGSLMLTTSDEILEVNVGSGLTDDDRKIDPNYYIGKIISIKYNEIIKSKGNKKTSLFLPIFEEVRTDKTTANSFGELA